MNIHEYQAKRLLNSFNVPTPVSLLAHTPLDCLKAFDQFGPIVIKAQVHAGGRGKAGGVRVAKSADEAVKIGNDLIGSTLVTYQTGPNGVRVNKLLCEPLASIKREMYLSFTIDRVNSGVFVIFSPTGGVDIEELSKTQPEKVRRVSLHPLIGFTSSKLNALLAGFNLPQTTANQLIDIMQKCLNMFIMKNLTLLEINPLAELENQTVVALDCKIVVDDNALFRHMDLSILEDYSQYSPTELAAKRKGLSYVPLDGNIGCMVNGAGLAMATMDAIKQAGGNPANFLDVGGGVSEEGLDEAMKLLLEDTKVKVIFINIFGGIVRCDLVASSIVKIFRESAMRKPAVVRLLGTNHELAKEILSRSEFEFQVAETLSEGARLAVQAVNG